MNAETVNKQCDNCKVWFVFLTTRDIYSHQQTRGWNIIYYCGNCGASVGTHPDTAIPLGPMATGKTRFLRAKAHATFDLIWRSGLLTRNGAVRWAAKELLIIDEFHITTLSDKELLKLITISEEYLALKGPENIERKIEQVVERRNRDGKRISNNNARYAKRRRKNR